MLIGEIKTLALFFDLLRHTMINTNGTLFHIIIYVAAFLLMFYLNFYTKTIPIAQY